MGPHIRKERKKNKQSKYSKEEKENSQIYPYFKGAFIQQKKEYNTLWNGTWTQERVLELELILRHYGTSQTSTQKDGSK